MHVEFSQNSALLEDLTRGAIVFLESKKYIVILYKQIVIFIYEHHSPNMKMEAPIIIGSNVLPD